MSDRCQGSGFDRGRVRDHELGREVLDGDSSCVDQLLSEMILHIDVLRSRVRDRVRRECERTRVVAINDESGSQLNSWVRWPPSPPGTSHMVRYMVMMASSSLSPASTPSGKVQLGLAMRSVKSGHEREY